jgi:hypothetical protein
LETIQVTRQNLSEFFHELGLDRRGKIVGVHELPGGTLHSFRDLGVAVAQRGHVDPGREIDVLIAVYILQNTATALLEYDREELDLTAQSLEIPGTPIMPFL